MSGASQNREGIYAYHLLISQLEFVYKPCRARDSMVLHVQARRGPGNVVILGNHCTSLVVDT